MLDEGTHLRIEAVPLEKHERELDLDADLREHLDERAVLEGALHEDVGQQGDPEPRERKAVQHGQIVRGEPALHRM